MTKLFLGVSVSAEGGVLPASGRLAALRVGDTSSMSLASSASKPSGVTCFAFGIARSDGSGRSPLRAVASPMCSDARTVRR